MKLRNIGTIISREYLVRVQKKSFLLTTFLVPVLFAAVCILPSVIMLMAKDKGKEIAVVDQSGIVMIFLVMGGQQLQFRTLLPRLPDGLGRLDAIALGQFVFGEDDAVAAFRVAAYCHGHLFQFGTQDAFYRCIKAVAVTV